MLLEVTFFLLLLLLLTLHEISLYFTFHFSHSFHACFIRSKKKDCLVACADKILRIEKEEKTYIQSRALSCSDFFCRLDFDHAFPDNYVPKRICNSNLLVF